jgi:hypothetical protein
MSQEHISGKNEILSSVDAADITVNKSTGGRFSHFEFKRGEVNQSQLLEAVVSQEIIRAVQC